MSQWNTPVKPISTIIIYDYITWNESVDTWNSVTETWDGYYSGFIEGSQWMVRPIIT